MYEDYNSLDLNSWMLEFNDDQLCSDSLADYLDFIRDSIIRYDYSEYGEYHHVVPRCIDRNKRYSDHTVKISARDHFLAHCKLIDCLKDKNLKYRLSCALYYMYPRVTSPEEIADAYQKSKEKHSELLRSRLTGTKLSQETVDKMRESQRRRYEDPEMRRQLSLSHKGHKFSEKAIENMRRANAGSNNPMYGKHHTPETIQKMNESRRLRGYNLVCKVCGRSFKSHAPNTKRCDDCR